MHQLPLHLVQEFNVGTVFTIPNGSIKEQFLQLISYTGELFSEPNDFYLHVLINHEIETEKVEISDFGLKFVFDGLEKMHHNQLHLIGQRGVDPILRNPLLFGEILIDVIVKFVHTPSGVFLR